MYRIFCFLCLAALAAGLGGNAGCSRQYYRHKADQEVYSLLKHGNTDPRWRINKPKITPDPASRLFDPFLPDCEPMPTDDPTAHRKMHHVAGMQGSPEWYDKGCTPSVENPNWRHFLLVNEKGEIPLDKEQAVELSIRHSPEYQSALESLYLSAMDVSRERFVYDVQFFGGDSIFYTARGRNRGYDTLQNNANFRVERALATGGQWVVELANSITWTLTGQKDWDVNTSLVNVSLVQPLLRGANRKVVLERLTQSERNFLSELRRMVLFQQGHYTRVVAGTGPAFTSGPSGTSRAGAPASGGFYRLLSGQIQIQNQRQNIIGLEENLGRFEALFDAGQLNDRYQIDEMRQNLLNSQSNLSRQVMTYRSNVESYIRSLGLPPDLKVNISDPLLEQFQLTSPTLTTLMEEVGDALAVIRKKGEPLPANFLRGIGEIIRRTEGEIAILEQDLETLQKAMPARISGLKDLEALLAERIANGERIDEKVYDSKEFENRIAKLRTQSIPDNLVRLRAIFVLLDLIAGTEESALRKMILEHSFAPSVRKALEDLKWGETAVTKADPVNVEPENPPQIPKPNETADQLKALGEMFGAAPPQNQTPQDDRIETHKIIEELRQKDEYRDWVLRVFSTFQYELMTLSLMQTRTRLDAMTLTPVSITAEEAFQTASEHRLDWMNQKSRLVDRWRQIDIAADKLKGDVRLTLNGDTGRIDRDGVHFGVENSRIQAGLEWTSPLNRHREMMDYRASQIAYQASRREYNMYVDGVQADLRDIVRMVQMSQINFEINRNAVLVGTVRVDVMQLRMDQPPQRGGRIDTNTSQQLINALEGLMRSQNDLLNAWVDFQTQRMLLDVNMGTMALDNRGHWIEPGAIGKGKHSEPEIITAPDVSSPDITAPDITSPDITLPDVTSPNILSIPVQAQAPILGPRLEPPKLNRRYIEDEPEKSK